MPRKKSRVVKAAKAVTKAVGGRALADYAGAKIAKATVPRKNRKYVKDTTTRKQAAKSALAVGANVASIYAGGGAAGVLTKASKVRKVARTAKAAKAAKNNAMLKRTFSGREKAALERAGVRNRRTAIQKRNAAAKAKGRPGAQDIRRRKRK